MTIGSRLDKLWPALTARERAVLVLRAWKEDREPDARVTWTMPDEQANEYNRLIRLMHGASELGVVLMWLEAVLRQAELKHSWYMTLVLIAAEMRKVAFWLAFDATEPITESAFRERLANGRGNVLSLNDAAELLVPGEADAGYARAVKVKRREMTTAIAAGALRARGNGSRARIAAGDLYDWAGLEFKAVTAYGANFDVHPDAEAEEVAGMQARRERLDRAVGRWLDDGLPMLARGAVSEEPDHDRIGQSFAHGLAASMREMVRELGEHFAALEAVAREVAAEFGGEDPLQPEARATLVECTARLQSLAEDSSPYVKGVAPGQPDEEILAKVRGFVRRDT